MNFPNFVFIHFAEPKRPKPKPISMETLTGINEVYKRTEEEKRRLQLESNLYKKWRLGTTEESILSNARSDHEALAKLNWLDRQVKSIIFNQIQTILFYF